MSNTPIHDQIQQNMRLFVAIEHGDQRMFEQALADGGDPFVKDSAQETLLHKAASSDRISSRFLNRVLELGIDAEAPNHAGETALHLAVWKGHDHKVRTMLKHGVDVHATTEKGYTVFHLLTPQAPQCLPRLLHMAGADDEKRDEDGRTAEEHHISKGVGFLLDDFMEWKERQGIVAPELENPTAHAVRTWDNPFCTEEVTLASWGKLGQALHAAQADGTEIAPAILLRIAASASRHGVLPQAMEALHGAGFTLQGDALLEAHGGLRAEAEELIRDGELASLFTRENWRGADARALARVTEALPPETKADIRNLNQLRVGLQQDAAMARGR